MKTIINYINEKQHFLVKGHTRKQINPTNKNIDPNEYQYYNHAIAAIDDLYADYDNPDERQEWEDAYEDGKDWAIRKIEELINNQCSSGPYSDDEMEDIFHDHVIYDVLLTFDELEDTEKVYKAYGIKK